MKDQYFGDVHDYIKYGVLRQLLCNGNVSAVVCWMLTQNDGRRDGRRLSYLTQPGERRDLDPPLFDCLRAAVLDRNERSIKIVEESGLLPNASFYSHLLADASDERRSYFDGLLGFSRGKDLIFFDPDNGLGVKSVPYGRKGSSKYLFLHEVSQLFSAGHSLLVYQHIPRKPRDLFIRETASDLMRETGAEVVYVFLTSNVAFFLVPRTDQVDEFAQFASDVQSNWGAMLRTRRYPDPNVSMTG